MEIKKNRSEALLIAGSQDGSILLIAVMIMLLITIIGFSAFRSTNTDLKVSQNDRCFKQNIYRAEAATFEVGQLMEADPDPKTNLKPPLTYSWLGDGSVFNPLQDVWGTANSSSSVVFADDSTFTVVFEGIAAGASLDMSKPTQLWDYSVYGRSEQCGGRVDVVMGYRRRY